MTAETMRLYKEARAIWWPWLVVTAAGVLATLTAMQARQGVQLGMLSRIWRDAAIPVGSFLGIPLIATMAFSLDFQHRTLALLLSQPIDRMRLWNEKMRVMVAAVVPPAIIYCIAWSFYAPHLDKNNPFASSGEPAPWAIAAICIVVAASAAPFWTLVARTTMGSMVLNGMFPWAIVFCFALLNDRVPANSGLWPMVRGIAAVAILVYVAVMLWLSRRVLARFQVTGATGGDLLIDSPLPVPRFFEEGFRCRPTGAILNLVRKELRLMRPVWALTLFSTAVWLTLAVFRALPAREQHVPITNAQTIMIALAGVLTMLIAVLSGTVTLGEERTSGAHAWHLTMPIASGTQWLVKLLVAVSTSVICGALIPLAILIGSGVAAGSTYRFAEPNLIWSWPLALSMVTTLAFWSACTVSGTVRATIWMFPIGWAMGLAFGAANWSASWLGDLWRGSDGNHWSLGVDPFVVLRFIDHFFGFMRSHDFSLMPPDPRLYLPPVFLVLLIQSYFLFRTQPDESKVRVVRALLPSVVIIFVCIFLLTAPFFLSAGAYRQVDRAMVETHGAIQAMQARGLEVSAQHPLQVSGEELAKASQISESTRRWLSDSTVTLAPLTNLDSPQRGDLWSNVNDGPDSAHPAYLATIRRSGYSCVVRFQPYPVHPNVALSYSFPKHGSVVANCN